MKVIKIWSVGSYKRFMWFELEDKVYCVRITQMCYSQLKALGIPTAQMIGRLHDSKM